MAAVRGKFGNSDELRSRWFPIKLVSVPYTSVSLSLFLSLSCRLKFFPVRIGEPFFFSFSFFRNRQVGLRLARLGMTQAGAMRFRGKIEPFSAVSLTLPSTRRSLVLTAGRSMGLDAFVFLLSPFLYPSHSPFTSFFLFLTTSHNPNGILSNI